MITGVGKCVIAESENGGGFAAKPLRELARETGLEPAASAVTGRRQSSPINTLSDSSADKTGPKALISDSAT